MKSILKKSFSAKLLKNGTVINFDRTFKADVLIENEKITRVHDKENPYSKSIKVDNNVQVYDCSNKYIIPGGIDTHTHMELPFMGEVAVDDFDKGTRAAVAGGTTCIVDFILPPGESLKEGFDLWRKKADGKVNCDYTLHCMLTKWNDNVRNEMKQIVDLGVQSFKIFLAYKDALMMDEANMFQIFTRTKELGAISLIHAENGNLIYEAQKKILSLGITGPEGHYLSRPETFEALATHQAITVAEYINSPIYIVHLMSKNSAFEVQRAIERGVPVFGETLVGALGADGRQLWNNNWNIAGPHVMSPPLNPDPTTKDKLMKLLHMGTIHTVGSDNCTFCLKQKELGRDNFAKIPNGVNGVEDRLAVMWTLGVKSGLISKGDFVKCSSTNAAMIFNMYPNKGLIAEGADADVVVWNGNDERVISKNTHNQAVDFNVFEGMVVSGTAEKTFSRGNLVYDNSKTNKFSELHKGKYVPRKPYGYPFERISELDELKNPLKLKVNRENKSDNLNPIYPETNEILKLKEKVSQLSEELLKLKSNKH